MSRVYIISDLHLGHKAICKYRTEFSTPEEMYQTFLSNTLETLDKRDTLWMLGDCFFTESSVDWLREVAASCGQVNWVLGNHDSDNSVRQKIIRTVLQEELINKIGSLFSYKGFWLSHAPIHPEELRGKHNIHGHTHRHVIDDTRYINACVEHTDWKPVEFKDLVSRSESV